MRGTLTSSSNRVVCLALISIILSAHAATYVSSKTPSAQKEKEENVYASDARGESLKKDESVKSYIEELVLKRIKEFPILAILILLGALIYVVWKCLPSSIQEHIIRKAFVSLKRRKTDQKSQSQRVLEELLRNTASEIERGKLEKLIKLFQILEKEYEEGNLSVGNMANLIRVVGINPNVDKELFESLVTNLVLEQLDQTLQANRDCNNNDTEIEND